MTRAKCAEYTPRCRYNDTRLPGGYSCYSTIHYLQHLSRAEIRVGNYSDHADFTKNELCYKIGAWSTDKRHQSFRCHQPIIGRYLSIQRRYVRGYLLICEVQIHGVLVRENDTKAVYEGDVLVNDLNNVHDELLTNNEGINELEELTKKYDTSPAGQRQTKKVQRAFTARFSEIGCHGIASMFCLLPKRRSGARHVTHITPNTKAKRIQSSISVRGIGSTAVAMNGNASNKKSKNERNGNNNEKIGNVKKDKIMRKKWEKNAGSKEKQKKWKRNKNLKKRNNGFGLRQSTTMLYLLAALMVLR